MQDLIKIMEPIFEGSIEPGEGYVKDGIVYARVCRDDLGDLLSLEKSFPECMRMDPTDIQRDLDEFPDLQVIAKDIGTGFPVGKASIVKVDPGGLDSEEVVKGSGGWYELYQKRSAHGHLHEATGIVIDRNYQGFPRKGIDVTLCLVLARTLVENTLKGDHFKRLTWSSSNYLFSRFVRKKLRLSSDAPLNQILDAYLKLDEHVRLELHHTYVDGVLTGVLKDIPLNSHAAVLKYSQGLIKVTDKNVQCPEDVQSLGMGTRFDGTQAIEALVEWQKSLLTQI